MGASSKYYVFLPPDSVVGPHRFDQLREWVAEGALPPETQVCAVGTETWTAFSELPRYNILTAAITRRIEERRQGGKSDWHSEPAPRDKIEKLEYFGIPFSRENLTRGRATDLINCFIAIHPDRNEEYGSRPATDEQRAELISLGISIGEMTFAKARGLIFNTRNQLDEEAKEHTIQMMILENRVNDDDVMEICHYREFSEPDLERLLKHLNRDLPNWREMNRFDLGKYVTNLVLNQL